jgi:methionine aminopeptidase
LSNYSIGDGSPPPSPPSADALAAVIAACKAGAKIVDLCDLGDNFMNECVPPLHVTSMLIALFVFAQLAYPPLVLTRLPIHFCSACNKEFKGKDIEKGIAVPTCISVNK